MTDQSLRQRYGRCPECNEMTWVYVADGVQVRGCGVAACGWVEPVAPDVLNRLLGAPVLPGFEG